MSLAQIPGRSPNEQGDERIRGDRALEDEMERRGKIVTIEATINNVETRIAHGQTTTPTFISAVGVEPTGFRIVIMTRRPDALSLYLRASSGSDTYQISLLIRKR